MSDWYTLYQQQATELVVFREYHRLLKRDPAKAERPEDCLFLPIQFFKTERLLLPGLKEEKVFLSSGTGFSGRSQHYVASLAHYQHAFVSCFNEAYGDYRNFRWIALLPSYLENGDSSLIYMVDHFIRDGLPGSGYWLKEDHIALAQLLNEQVPTILIGVTFALISTQLSQRNRSHLIVMETGGMKGRGEELTRSQVHSIIRRNFGCSEVHSEYGMTELMTQAYSKKEGFFYPPESLKVFIRDPRDPFTLLSQGKLGAINLIDLNNQHSCAFIETSDLGRKHHDGSFEVLGRMDHAELRGCNLLING